MESDLGVATRPRQGQAPSIHCVASFSAENSEPCWSASASEPPHGQIKKATNIKNLFLLLVRPCIQMWGRGIPVLEGPAVLEVVGEALGVADLGAVHTLPKPGVSVWH